MIAEGSTPSTYGVGSNTNNGIPSNLVVFIKELP